MTTLSSSSADGTEATASAAERVVRRNFVALGAGETLARLLAFGATVFLARTLGAAAFGVIGFATAVLLYFTYVAECGIDSIGVREVARDPARVAELTAPLLIARLGVAALLVGVLAGTSLLWLPQPDGAILAAYSLTLLVVALNPRWVLLGLERGATVAVARVLTEAAALVLVLALVRGPGDVALVPLAQVVGAALGAALLLASLRRIPNALKTAVDWVLTRAIFRESWQLVANSMFALLIFNADLIFLRIFRDPATVGQYAAAYTLISFLSNLGVAFGQSLLPTLTRRIAAGEQSPALFRSALGQMFVVTLPLAVGGSLLSHEIILLIFGPKFRPAADVLAILVASVVPAVLRNVPQAALIALGRQDVVLKTSAAIAGVNLSLNAVLIPRYGMIGAAMATVTSESLRFIISAWAAWILGLRIGGAGRLAVPIAAVAIMAGVVLGVRPAGLWLAVAAGAFSYGAVLAVLGVLDLKQGTLRV